MDEISRKNVASFTGFFITLYALRQFEIKLEVLVKDLFSFSYIEMLMFLTVFGSIGLLIMYIAKNYDQIKFYISNKFS